jgi:hypothetical protein
VKCRQTVKRTSTTCVDEWFKAKPKLVKKKILIVGSNKKNAHVNQNKTGFRKRNPPPEPFRVTELNEGCHLRINQSRILVVFDT